MFLFKRLRNKFFCMLNSNILTNTFVIADYEIPTFIAFFFHFQLVAKNFNLPEHTQNNKKYKKKRNYFNHLDVTN